MFYTACAVAAAVAIPWFTCSKIQDNRTYEQRWVIVKKLSDKDHRPEHVSLLELSDIYDRANVKAISAEPGKILLPQLSSHDLQKVIDSYKANR